MVMTCQTISDRILLQNISWPTYVAMLAEMGDDRVTRVAYDRGMLEIMSPSLRHENWKRLIENLIVILATELKLNMKSLGSVTCNRPDLRRGAEPDSGFYIQNEPLMRNKKELDLTKDPPPDLVLEVDYTSSSVDRQIIYAALGVPELWRYEEQVLQIYQLQAGRYVPCTGSPTFANLPLREIPRFIEKSWEIGELPMMESFKTWVRQQLAELP